MERKNGEQYYKHIEKRRQYEKSRSKEKVIENVVRRRKRKRKIAFPLYVIDNHVILLHTSCDQNQNEKSQKRWTHAEDCRWYACDIGTL